MSLRALAFTTSALIAVVAAAAPLRAVEGVSLQGDGADAALAITTDKPANFTSFKLTRPTRIVVDFPETAATSQKQDAPEGGLVTRWSVEALGDEASPTARLVVEVQGDADYTLAADGRTVSLKLRPATGRPLVALAADAPTTAAKAEPAADDGEKAEKARLAAEAKEAAERELAAEKAAREEKARLARETAEKAEAERVAKVAAEKAEKAEKARLAREAAEKAEKERLAGIAAAKAMKAEKARLAREAAEKAEKERLAGIAAAKAVKAEKARLAREAAEKAEKERLAKLAAAKAEKARLAREAAEKAEKARLAKVAAEKAAKAEKARLAREERDRSEASRAAAHETAKGRAALTGIGFQRTAGGARVTVRTSHPVAFSVRDPAGDACVIDLEQTQIAVANNRRPLDTRFFGTAVARVVPHEDHASGRVSIELELAHPSDCEVHAAGGAIVIDVSGDSGALQAAVPTEGSP